MNLTELIPEGKENKVNRHQLIELFAHEFDTSEKDAERKFQYWLAAIRQNAVVITTGSGYYRPMADRPEEVEEAKLFVAREISRSTKIQKNLKYTNKWLADVSAGRI